MIKGGVHVLARGLSTLNGVIEAVAAAHDVRGWDGLRLRVRRRRHLPRRRAKVSQAPLSLRSALLAAR